MEIKKLTAADMAQVRKVWQTCFNDSDAFLDAYFSGLVSIEDGYGFFDGNKLLSDMFTFELAANISGMVYQSEFIAGCATLPEARNQNLMRNLMQTALSDMQQRDISVCFLHPFLHSFYRKFGFETVAYVNQKVAVPQGGEKTDGVHIASSMEEFPFDAVYASYQAYVTQFGNYFMRSEGRMRGWLELLFADGGKAAYIETNEDTPYALFYETKNDQGPLNEIFELVYFDAGQLDALVNGTGAPASYNLPSRFGLHDVAEYTMMRVLDPQMMLKWYQYPAGTKSFVININDAFLGNDYNLRVTPGEKEAAIEPVESPSDIVIDISGLATLFTGTYNPDAFPAAVPIFKPRSSCYFETY